MVVTDLDMPVLDGFELREQIRLLPGAGEVPVIALTARVDEASRERAREAGFADYVVKLDADRVIAAVRSALLREKEVGA